MTKANELRQQITARIVEAVKAGTVPWRRPWSGGNTGGPCNFANGRRYQGINPLVLLLEAEEKGFQSRYWGTAASWIKHVGAHVRKAEKASYVVFFKPVPKKDRATGEVERDNEGREKTIPILKQYAVFNAEQMQAPTVDTLLGVPYPFGIVRALLGDFSRTKRYTPTTAQELHLIATKYLPAGAVPSPSATREEIAEAIHVGIAERLNSYKAVGKVLNTEPDFEPAERLLTATGADIRHGGNRAFYRLKPNDFVQLPPKVSFHSMADYYQTALHELCHWVVNGGRVEHKGERSYAFFELVAEIGACFALMQIGVPCSEKMLPRSESYVSHWLKEMGGDPKYIFDAASLASKAADYLLAFVGLENPAYDDADEEEATIAA